MCHGVCECLRLCLQMGVCVCVCDCACKRVCRRTPNCQSCEESRLLERVCECVSHVFKWRWKREPCLVLPSKLLKISAARTYRAATTGCLSSHCFLSLSSSISLSLSQARALTLSAVPSTPSYSDALPHTHLP